MAIITISRGTFSGGEALAKRLADRLGYQCISREVILEAATRYGVPADELAAAMERPPWFWERVVGARTTHLVFVQAALCEHAREDRLVYHGHVGHLLLPGIAHVIRIRVIADLEYRITVAMQTQNLSRKDALASIEKVDKERREWIRFLFDVEWEDPSLYDAVLNLSRMSLDTACDTVAHMTEQPEFTPSATSVKAMHDLALSSRVAAALQRDARTWGADLRTAADGGTVTISGTARFPGDEETIASVVRQVEGVKEVRCELRSPVAPFTGLPVC